MELANGTPIFGSAGPPNGSVDIALDSFDKCGPFRLHSDLCWFNHSQIASRDFETGARTLQNFITLHSILLYINPEKPL